MAVIVSRKDWKAEKPKGAFKKMEKCDGVVLHYPGANLSLDTHEKCVHTVQSIQNSHLHNKDENYLDIAYNLVVCPHEYIFIARGRNVCSGANGTVESNLHLYAICILISVDEKMSAPLKRVTLNAIAYLRNGKVAVGSKRLGHKDIHPTACPGKSVYSWVEAGLPRPEKLPPVKPPTPKPEITMARIKPLGVKPGKDHPQVKELDKALTRIGFKVASPSTYYGKTTSDAVARFHSAYPKYRSAGKTYDPAIGARGWRKLRKLAYQPVTKIKK